jgi:hypothetical protein
MVAALSGDLWHPLETAGAPPFNSLGRRFLLSKSQRNCRDGVDDHDPPHSVVRHTLWRIEADAERAGDSEH